MSLSLRRGHPASPGVDTVFLTIVACLLVAVLMIVGFVMAWFGIYEIVSAFWGTLFTVLGIALFFGTPGFGLIMLFKSPSWLWQAVLDFF